MSLDLGALLEGHVFAFLLVFCRVGGMFMVMPGIGETFVPVRTRLHIALAFSFILTPFLTPILPTMPSSVVALAGLIGAELCTGIFFGMMLRLLLTVLEITGSFISMQIGLSNAMILNPTMASQGTVTGAMLSMMGVALIFESTIAHDMLRALISSYSNFKAGVFLPVGDMTQFISQTVAEAFSAALKIAGPFMVLGIVFQFAAGVMVKMVPQMQIFFVVAPLQIVLGLAMFAFMLGTMMNLWGASFEAGLSHLFFQTPIAR